MSCVVVTNADRIVFPAAGYTKGQVVEYYERLGARILPHVVGRALTIRRYPKGIGQPGFFQKNVPPHYPASMARVEVPRREGVTIHPVVSEPEHLTFLANQGAIELHVPCARTVETDCPDRVVIDLDPPEGATELVKHAAVLVRDAMAELGLPTALIATGSKGYHVVAAIEPRISADAMAHGLRELGALLAARHPDTLTTAFRVAQRRGKVFVDWLRNAPHATVVVPYSLRARPKASVATPLAWSELDATSPDAFTLADSEALLERADRLANLATTPADPRSFAEAVSVRFRESGIELPRFDRFRS